MSERNTIIERTAAFFSIKELNYDTVMQWVEAEEQRTITARRKRLDREYKKSIVIEGKHMTIIAAEPSVVPNFLMRLTLRDITTRELATVSITADGKFGYLNWKGIKK